MKSSQCVNLCVLQHHHTNAFTHPCPHSRTYKHTHTHTHARTHARTYTHARTHTHTHAHAYTHTHTHERMPTHRVGDDRWCEGLSFQFVLSEKLLHVSSLTGYCHRCVCVLLLELKSSENSLVTFCRRPCRTSCVSTSRLRIQFSLSE